MNPTSLKAAICINLAAILSLVAPAAHAGVVYIDTLTSVQTLTTSNSTATNTSVAASAIGGFRTLDMTSIDNDIPELNSRLRVATNAIGPRLELGSQTDATATFTVTWGGAGGIAGLGGIDFRDGIAATNFSLLKSTLNFSLLSSDSANPFTWSFTDTNNVTATYASAFPTNASPALPYSISLASFVNSGSIDWSSINFVSLSGGGATSLDLTLTGPFSVNAQPIPEPGTWAAAGLLVLTAFYIRRRRMRATTEEEPAAA